jgi:hypothetical protein
MQLLLLAEQSFAARSAVASRRRRALHSRVRRVIESVRGKSERSVGLLLVLLLPLALNDSWNEKYSTVLCSAGGGIWMRIVGTLSR